MNSPGGWAAKKLRYKFHDNELLQLALTHRSYGSKNNERLEFLGDSVLGYIVAEALYQQKHDVDEGALTRLRAQLVKKETLAEIAREIGLAEQMQLGSGEARSGAHQAESIRADGLEALLGAILLDGGIDAAKETVLHLFESRLTSLPSIESLKDAKTRLQEFLQSSGLPVPVYAVVREQGPPHAREFEVSCSIPERDLRTGGYGPSRRIAEQEAAAMALQELEE